MCVCVCVCILQREEQIILQITVRTWRGETRSRPRPCGGEKIAKRENLDVKRAIIACFS